MLGIRAWIFEARSAETMAQTKLLREESGILKMYVGYSHNVELHLSVTELLIFLKFQKHFSSFFYNFPHQFSLVGHTVSDRLLIRRCLTGGC